MNRVDGLAHQQTLSATTATLQVQPRDCSPCHVSQSTIARPKDLSDGQNVSARVSSTPQNVVGAEETYTRV
jgi:hypothetical protein